MIDSEAYASYIVNLLAHRRNDFMAQAKPKHSTPQLSVRSPFAKARASKLAKLTGMTITEVVEDALRAYQPASKLAHPGGLIEKGGILVKPKGQSAQITHAQAEAELEEIRSGARE